MKRRSKRSLKQDDVEENISKPIYIPSDITVEILSKLPLKSLARLRCVSKLWYKSLITDSIKTRSMTQPPSLLVMFSNSYTSSSTTYPLNTKEDTFISVDKESTHELPRKLRSNSMCGYVRGLMSFESGPRQCTIYNVTTKQSVVLPKVKYNYSKSYLLKGGLFGYDPVENQYKVLCFTIHSSTSREACLVFTFPSPEKEWRKVVLESQNYVLPHPDLTSNVCINGIIYYLGKTRDDLKNVLGRFNVRFERLHRIEMPESLMSIDLGTSGVGTLEVDLGSLKFVDYQGKLGCISFDSTKQTTELWIMEDDMEKVQEWSKISLLIPPYLLKTLDSKHCIAGVTRNGHREIVIMPRILKPTDKLLYVYFYDPKQNKTRRVELESTLEAKVRGVDMYIYSQPDHVENTLPLVLTTPQSNQNQKLATPPQPPVHDVWFPPPYGVCKCNIAAIWSKTEFTAGAAWVLRDSRGLVLLHSRTSFSQVYSKEQASIMSWSWAFESMHSHRLNKVIFTSDTKEIVQVIMNPSMEGQVDMLTTGLRVHPEWQVAYEHPDANKGALAIARSVTREGRAQSYVARGAPIWLATLFAQESIPLDH